jgi:hypothetical protein
MNSVNMTTTYANIATSQPYGSTQTHTVTVTVPFSRSSGAVSTGFDLLAISN